MKYFTTVLLFCLIAGFLNEIADGVSCTKEQSLKDNCNYCQCPFEGNIDDAGCTKMACDGYNCTAGANWKKPGEQCECDSQGRTICVITK